MSDVELTDAEREALSRCPRCRHSIMAHNRGGCVACVPPMIGGAGTCCVLTPTDILAARLSQEREQVRGERDREWVAWHEALLAAFDWTANDLAYKAPEQWPALASAALRRLDERARLLPPNLAQDGPRPAQDEPVANGHQWPCPGFYNGNHHSFRDGQWACSCPMPRPAQEGERADEWECGPHANAWNGHDARCRRVAPEDGPR